jgi:hypothetical protein
VARSSRLAAAAASGASSSFNSAFERLECRIRGKTVRRWELLVAECKGEDRRRLRRLTRDAKRRADAAEREQYGRDGRRGVRPVRALGPNARRASAMSQSASAAKRSGNGRRSCPYWWLTSNESGELGDGTTTDRRVPVGVYGLASGVAALMCRTDLRNEPSACVRTEGSSVRGCCRRSLPQLKAAQNAAMLFASFPLSTKKMLAGVEPTSTLPVVMKTAPLGSGTRSALPFAYNATRSPFS